MPKSAAEMPMAPPPNNPHQPDTILRARADALFRSAAECCRQHARYARLVKHDACEAEQRTACKAAGLYDELLADMVRSYEKAAARVPGPADDGWWHQANILLQASREHLRHLHRCDRAIRQLGSHSLAELDELTTEYELSASALLALQRAAEGYRKLRPAAELRDDLRPSAAEQGSG